MSWYRTFFTYLPNEFWRRMASPALTAADIGFVERQLGLRPGDRVLDVPCGSGRHSVALAAAGYRVTGVDISEEAIAYARSVGPEVEFVLGDMRELPQTGDFDAAVCLGNSFGYLPAAELAEFIRALAGAVRAGGGLVVDFNAAAESVLVGGIGEPRVMHAGDIVVDAVTEYDIAGSRLLSRYDFRRGTESLKVTAVHHVFTCGHLAELLEAGGFDVVGWFADPDGRAFQVGDGRLLLVARRRHPVVEI